MKLKEELGQVWTPDHIVDDMIALATFPVVKGFCRILDPSVGARAIFNKLPSPKVGIEYDRDRASRGVLLGNFLEHSQKYTSIIANPPYVRARDALCLGLKPELKSSNLYCHFIWHSIDCLVDGGELVFLTPSAFMTATACKPLLQRLVSEGSFTHFTPLGCDVFETASPFVALWRWVKGRKSKKLKDGRQVSSSGGFIHFLESNDGQRLGDVFNIYAGLVTGCDKVFKGRATSKDPLLLTASGFVHVIPERSNRLTKYRDLLESKPVWNKYNRGCTTSGAPGIYCRARTRKDPFFYEATPHELYDGTLYALYPKNRLSVKELKRYVRRLNAVDWEATSFFNGGRLTFTISALKEFLIQHT